MAWTIRALALGFVGFIKRRVFLLALDFVFQDKQASDPFGLEISFFEIGERAALVFGMPHARLMFYSGIG